jgi:DNA-binding MarR family transcriptional regulator
MYMQLYTMTNKTAFSALEFECVAQSLRRAARLITRRYEDALRAVDLTASQYTILHALQGGRQIPQGMLAEVLGFEQTTMTRLIALLTKRGLISVLPDPKDKRGRRLEISSQGLELFKVAMPLWQRAQDRTLDRLAEAEWATVRKALNSITREG